MGGKPTTPRKVVNVAEPQFKRFIHLVDVYRQQKGIPNLKHTQAFDLVLSAAEEMLIATGVPEKEARYASNFARKTKAMRDAMQAEDAHAGI